MHHARYSHYIIWFNILACAERFRILGIHFCAAPRWSVYRRNSEINPTAPQLPEIEAIQTSLFVDVPDVLSAMPESLSASLRFKILRLLLLHWTPSAIAEEIHCCPATVYNVQENLFMYNSSFRSQFRFKDASWKIFKIAENDLIVYLEDQSWIMQKEMIWYIWEKWDINMHQFMILRILKRKDWSIKKEQRVEVR